MSKGKRYGRKTYIPRIRKERGEGWSADYRSYIPQLASVVRYLCLIDPFRISPFLSIYLFGRPWVPGPGSSHRGEDERESKQKAGVASWYEIR